MSEWLTRVLNKSKEEGIQEGREEGIEKGKEKGEDELSEALDELREQGRDSDVWKALKDKQFRAQILEAFRAKRAETSA